MLRLDTFERDDAPWFMLDGEYWRNHDSNQPKAKRSLPARFIRHGSRLGSL